MRTAFVAFAPCVLRFALAVSGLLVVQDAGEHERDITRNEMRTILR